MAANPKRLLIVDPTLKSLGGHSYHYDLAVAQAAATSFTVVEIYGDRKFPAIANAPLPIHRRLNRIPIDWLKQFANAVFYLPKQLLKPKMTTELRPGNATVLAEVPSLLLRVGEWLRAADLTFSLSRMLSYANSMPTHLFIQHARMGDLLAIAGPSKWYREVTFHLVLRLSPEFTCGGFEALPTFSARLQRLITRGNVVFYTDSALLTAQYRALIGNTAQFQTLPIPVLIKENTSRNDTTNTGLRVAMLGPARLEKGFAMLPEIIRHLPRMAGTTPITLAVQTSVDAVDPRVQSITRWLREEATKNTQLRILEGPASEAQYFTWFGQTDILLAPYSSPKYAASTSGIFVEALHFCVPTIAWRGTWMAMHIEQAAAEGMHIGEVIGSLDTLAETVQRIAADLARYRQDIATYLPRWTAFNNPAKLVAMLETR